MGVRSSMLKEPIAEKAENWANVLACKTRHVLPHVAHICIVSNFIEDGVRMIIRFNNRVEYLHQEREIPKSIANAIIVVNMIAQVAAVAMVLLNKYFYLASGVLTIIAWAQIIVGATMTDYEYLLRKTALFGSLVLLAAETKMNDQCLTTGLPSTEGRSVMPYLRLAGRVLIVAMLLTLVRFTPDVESVLSSVIGVVFAFLIGIGYKTTASSILAVAILAGSNVYLNKFWGTSVETYLVDHKRYHFFQHLSVIGGLLLVIARGPGVYSIDERKKRW